MWLQQLHLWSPLPHLDIHPVCLAGVGSIWNKIQQQQKRLLKAAPEGIESNIKSVVKMGSFRSQLKKTAGQLQEKAPQLTIAGGGLFMTLNNWGLVPESDVLPLEQFNRVWQPDEPERFVPCFVLQCLALPCPTLWPGPALPCPAPAARCLCLKSAQLDWEGAHDQSSPT